MTILDKEIDELKQFTLLFETTSSLEELQMECVLNGMGHWATKQFFTDKVFNFIFKNKVALHREPLKLKIRLMKNLPKLQNYFQSLLLDEQTS